eukprot:PhF_6_TR25081/c0_g1_i3/m.34419
MFFQQFISISFLFFVCSITCHAQQQQQHVIPTHTYACTEAKFCTVIHSLQNAVMNHSAPGIAAAAGNSTSMLFMGVAGRYTYNSSSATITHETLFDMASCTKVLATTTAVALLYQGGFLDLDWLVADDRLLGPGFASSPGKGDVTVRHLLVHSAGFPPDPTPTNYWDPTFPCPNNREYHPTQDYSCVNIIYSNLLYNQTLVTPPGAAYVYSDLSFITLMFVVAQRVKQLGLITPTELLPECSDPTLLSCYYLAYVHHNILTPSHMTRS